METLAALAVFGKGRLDGRTRSRRGGPLDPYPMPGATQDARRNVDSRVTLVCLGEQFIGQIGDDVRCSAVAVETVAVMTDVLLGDPPLDRRLVAAGVGEDGVAPVAAVAVGVLGDQGELCAAGTDPRPAPGAMIEVIAARRPPAADLITGGSGGDQRVLGVERAEVVQEEEGAHGVGEEWVERGDHMTGEPPVGIVFRDVVAVAQDDRSIVIPLQGGGHPAVAGGVATEQLGAARRILDRQRVPVERACGETGSRSRAATHRSMWARRAGASSMTRGAWAASHSRR
jgi:hypothetical protein